MNIPKAIEILETETGSRHEPEDPDLYDAQQLGIEALRETKRLRTFTAWFLRKRLPGETEE